MALTEMQREPSLMRDTAHKVSNLDTLTTSCPKLFREKPRARWRGDAGEVATGGGQSAAGVNSVRHKPRCPRLVLKDESLVDEHFVTCMREAEGRRDTGVIAIRCGYNPGVAWSIVCGNAGVARIHYVPKSERDPYRRTPSTP